MTKGMSLGLLVVGIIVVVFGVLEHYIKLVNLLHFSSYVVIAGLIVIAVGVWGIFRGRSGV